MEHLREVEPYSAPYLLWPDTFWSVRPVRQGLHYRSIHTDLLKAAFGGFGKVTTMQANEVYATEISHSNRLWMSNLCMKAMLLFSA